MIKYQEFFQEVLPKSDLEIKYDAGTKDEIYLMFENIFIRLVVRDHIDRGDTLEGKLYDSHFGLSPTLNRELYIPDFGSTGTTDYSQGNERALLGHTRVPMDYSEWFFIVASYNPG